MNGYGGCRRALRQPLLCKTGSREVIFDLYLRFIMIKYVIFATENMVDYGE